jgi:hypothetical protein
MMRVPSSENATDCIEPSLPPKAMGSSVPDCVSQTRIDWSYEPETTRNPQGENAIDETESVWPCPIGRNLAPNNASQMRMVPSTESQETIVPATTQQLWPGPMDAIGKRHWVKRGKEKMDMCCIRDLC